MHSVVSSTKGSIFVLSGEETTLPFAEIQALVSTYSPDCETVRSGKRVVTSSLSDPDVVSKVTERAAYCRFGGSIVSRASDIEDLAGNIEIDLSDSRSTFAVDSISLNMDQCGQLGAKIKSNTRGRVSLEDPDYLFQLESVGKEYILGVTSQGYKKFQWKSRRPRARRFFLPSSIYPKLARLLVNLSRVKEGELFADPFCGTASLLIESSLMGMRSIGIEITKWIARGAGMNLKGFSLPYESIIRADSCSDHLPILELDGMATDVPYGRASSTKGVGTENIVLGFLRTASDSLHSTPQKKKYCVIMHPSTVNLQEKIEMQGNSFQLREQHLLYVHRNLTRAISVLERNIKE